MKPGFYVCRHYGRGVTKTLFKLESVRFESAERADHWKEFLQEETPKWKDDFFVMEIPCQLPQ